MPAGKVVTTFSDAFQTKEGMSEYNASKCHICLKLSPPMQTGCTMVSLLEEYYGFVYKDMSPKQGLQVHGPQQNMQHVVADGEQHK